jgi:urease accessory protein
VKRSSALLPGLAVFALAATQAWGHPGHPTHAAFGTGAVHPFTGLDHLLVMAGVGLWAGQRGGSSVWRVPAMFLTGMLLASFTGGIAGLPGVETAVASTLLALGLVLLFAWRVAEPVALAATLACGVLHGLAHVSELPAGASIATYVVGFLLGTALLHGLGIAGARLLGRHPAHPAFRWSGALLVAVGLSLIAGA